MFAAKIAIDWNSIFAGLAFAAAVAMAVAVVRLLRRVSASRKRAREVLKWVEFPGKRGLALAQSIEGSAAYDGVVEGHKVAHMRGAKFDLPDDRKRAPLEDRYVCVAAQCQAPQPVGLQLWKETANDEIRKETRKLNEVIIGIEELDRALIIRGKQAAEIRALLGKPEVSQALLAFFGDWPESIVSDYWVKCEADLANENPPAPEAMLHAALHLAKTLDQHAKRAGRQSAQ
ncbi:MAG: hypothetical protein IT461_03770 [Planctomycetes bacterium]|jgi:hypothetical protein|nr:hypothetical protein [Planctomycetota bacterium]